MRHHRLPTIAAVCVAAVLAACSPTTYDSTADTQPREATSTTLPTGTAAELLLLRGGDIECGPAFRAFDLLSRQMIGGSKALSTLAADGNWHGNVVSAFRLLS